MSEAEENSPGLFVKAQPSKEQRNSVNSLGNRDEVASVPEPSGFSSIPVSNLPSDVPLPEKNQDIPASSVDQQPLTNEPTSECTDQNPNDDLYSLYKQMAIRADLSSIENTNIVHLCGKDSLERPVVMIEPANIQTKQQNLDLLLLYFLRVMDPIVEDSYVIVFISTNIKRENRPPFEWLKRAYGVFNRRYKKNLKTLYLVHPTMALRATLTLCRPFVSAKFWKKVVYIEDLNLIYKTIDRSQITFPNYAIRHNAKLCSHPPVFGTPLPKVLEIEHNPDGVPLVIQKGAIYIVDHCDVEGIFRHSGTGTHIDELKHAFDRGEDVDLTDEDPHDVAGLFKQFLRELPDPLFTGDCHEAFLQIQVALQENDEAWLATVRSLLSQLPIQNLRVIKTIFDLITIVSSRSDVNLMTDKNLAVVFGPNCLRSSSSSSVVALKEIPVINSFIKKIIEHYWDLFAPGTKLHTLCNINIVTPTQPNK